MIIFVGNALLMLHQPFLGVGVNIKMRKKPSITSRMLDFLFLAPRLQRRGCMEVGGAVAPKPGRCCAPVTLLNKTRAECDLRPHPTLVIYSVSAMAAETSELIFAIEIIVL